MGRLNRIVLVRHGETVGQSSIRYWGATDVALSVRGREQVRAAALEVPGDAFDVVLTSPLSRAWKSAQLVARGRQIHLIEELREIDFGDWEGLTASEIRMRDPILYEDWQARRPGFAYPGGERPGDLQCRVDRAVDGMLASGASSILVVVHKGVIRAIVRKLAGVELGGNEPALGGLVQLTRGASGSWFIGPRGSKPLK